MLSLFLFYLLQTSSESRPPVPGAGLGALIMWYICNKRKRDPIGGWLLYFYIQLYLGAIFSIVIFGVSLENYVPSLWEDKTLYLLFLMTTLPVQIILMAQVAVASILLKRREWRYVGILKLILVVDILVTLFAAGIDVFYFPENLAFDFLSLIWPAVWLPYFLRSTRVRHVFQTHDFHTSPFAMAPA